jgi:hypothetical protein
MFASIMPWTENIALMEKQIQKTKSDITLDKREHIEDAIACITSTAEPTASFRFWISAW